MEAGLLLLWQRVLNELGTWCGTSTTLDWKTAKRRFEHEGLSFLTITLADLGKDFQKSLDDGQLTLANATGFRCSGGLPRFLGGFLELVFERGTGRLLESPNIDAIFAVRQLTLMMAKLAVPCSKEREMSAMKGYIQVEQEVKASDKTLTAERLSQFRRVALLLFGDVLQNVNEQVDNLRIVPKHGPGATADKLEGNRKYYQTTWPQRLESVFPSLENALPNPGLWEHNLSRFTFLDPGAEIPVRVISVPKTLKTPRIIAMEPTAMQYMQQGLMECFVGAIEQHDTCSRLVGFSDQSRNRDMAREGSLTGSLATLDLSEASDRVSNQLVREMLSYWPSLRSAVDATRSRKADVPGHGVIRLAKFASMGSALCFPIEAMVFATIIFVGIETELRRPLTRKDVESFLSTVRVYGDDIIVPVDMVSPTVSALEDFGLRVNTGKSFWNGKFRESCGGDFYDGHDVTPIRVRQGLPSRLADVAEVQATVSFRNQLYGVGLWHTAAWLDDRLRVLFRGHYPVVRPESPVLGRFSFLGHESEKLHRSYHSPLVKGYTAISPLPRNSLDGNDALLKFFLLAHRRVGDVLPDVDKKHLERSGRPKSSTLRLRWASAV